MGNEEYMKGNYEEAVECYTKAIELKSDNPIYFSNSK